MTHHTAVQTASVREELRAHTHVQHERLHRHSSFAALFDQTLEVGEYRKLIKRLYGFYAPLDQAISDILAGTTLPPGGYDYARRAGHLAQDLRDLGYDDRAVKDAPRCPLATDLVTPRTLGGVLYVIEGATLGGAGIDRAVHRMLGHDETAGRRFWAWCRARNKQRWSMMNRYLDHLLSEGAAIDDLKQGACATFLALAEWLAPLDRARVQAGTRRSWQ